MADTLLIGGRWRQPFHRRHQLFVGPSRSTCPIRDTRSDLAGHQLNEVTVFIGAGPSNALVPDTTGPTQRRHPGIDEETVLGHGRGMKVQFEVGHNKLETSGGQVDHVDPDRRHRIDTGHLAVGGIYRMIDVAVGVELVEPNIDRGSRCHRTTVALGSGSLRASVPAMSSLGSEDFDFVGSQGETLAGRLHLPEEKALGSILFAHCFSCSKDLSIQTRLANGLAEAGYAVLRFDFTGLGESGGDFADTTLSANVSDLTRAAAALIAEGFGPCGMVGHSLGGAAAILAAQRIKTVRSLATIAAPSVAAHVSHLFGDRWDDLLSGTPVEVAIGPRALTINPSFATDLNDHDLRSAAFGLNRPYAIFHAEDDTVVGIDNAEALFEGAQEPKRLIRLAEGDHMFVKPEHTAILTAEVRAWFDETLLD